MRRLSKKYIKKSTRDASVLALESAIIVKYGLRNKKELNKARGFVQKYLKLNRTTEVGSATYTTAFHKLVKLGVLPENFSNQEIHTLKVENFLKRRLQTIVSQTKEISLSSARQLITHGQIKINGVIKRYPSYLIRLDSEITFK
jgi:small subunit ribosomal protein S4